MKIIHINYSDIKGGAGRAAYRIHNSLLNENIDSLMWVNRVFSKDITISGPSNKVAKIFARAKAYLIHFLIKLFKPSIHSPSVLPSRWLNQINSSDADIIHLHWVQGEMLSISDIGQIQKPIVWTLHDMWAFCGAEHYSNNYFWKDGYTSRNRINLKYGFDLNRWTWKRKKKYWKTPFQIVTPSNWLANCVKKSRLMCNWPVSVVNNPIDIQIWSPINKKIARERLNLPSSIPLILFGAMDGGIDSRKGFDLLTSSLKYLKNNLDFTNLELITFGQKKKQSLDNDNFNTHYFGHVYDDQKLRTLYSAADAVVIPSRQDNLPNIGLEAQACALPIVAFDVGGLSDIIDHKITGYLAKPFEIENFAKGIVWVLQNNKNNQLSKQSELKAASQFSSDKIASKYLDIYKKVLNNQSLKNK